MSHHTTIEVLPFRGTWKVIEGTVAASVFRRMQEALTYATQRGRVLHRAVAVKTVNGRTGFTIPYDQSGRLGRYEYERE